MSASRPSRLDLGGRPAVAEVWSQAWPTVLTMSSYTLMQFVDQLMVARVGYLEVAAQGNAGLWAFTPIAVLMGAVTVVNTFVSQNFGAGRASECARYGWAALWLALFGWAFVLVPCGLGIPYAFEAMVKFQDTEDPVRLVRLQTEYAQILLFFALVSLATRSMHNFFFGLHRPRIITVSSIIGNITNVIANYILIFGEDGMPGLGLPGIPGTTALGLKGAAIGTVIGTTVEFLIPFAIFLGPRMHAEFQTRFAWRLDMAAIKDLIRVGWPAAMQYGMELTAWAVFMSVLVGTFGDHHMSAGWIALRYMHMSFMPAVGFSTAVTAIVGKHIGAGDPDTAAARARLGVAMAVAWMTVCAILFVIFRHQMMGLFVGGEETTAEDRAAIVSIGGKLLICAAIFQTMDAVGIVYSGALRGAGDTVWPGVVMAISSWTLIIGGGMLAVRYFPQLESVGPWLGATAYIIVFGGLVAWRFEVGRWRSIDLLKRTGGSPAAA